MIEYHIVFEREVICSFDFMFYLVGQLYVVFECDASVALIEQYYSIMSVLECILDTEILITFEIVLESRQKVFCSKSQIYIKTLRMHLFVSHLPT